MIQRASGDLQDIMETNRMSEGRYFMGRLGVRV
jgi:hypothetical protein